MFSGFKVVRHSGDGPNPFTEKLIVYFLFLRALRHFWY
jgi:hypothetical protein